MGALTFSGVDAEEPRKLIKKTAEEPFRDSLYVQIDESLERILRAK